MPENLDVRCAFYARSRVSDTPGAFRFDSIGIETPEGFGRLPTQHPPAVGDLISLSGQRVNAVGEVEQVDGMFRVVERQWLHPEYGSRDWPRGGPAHRGPLLDVIVEAAEGAFAEEVDRA